MQAPDTHPREAERLRALRAMGVLDTPPDPALDALTESARRLFGVPTALVSLVDANRQWFKSRQGLEAAETGRDISLCGHAILQDDVFVIEDAAADPRFADNPLVQGELHLRFYAGVPLKGPAKLPIGTLCLLAYAPRSFSAADREALKDLGRVAEGLLWVRQQAHTDESEARLAAIIDNLAEGIVFQDLQGVILAANPAAAAILGRSMEQLLGRASTDSEWRTIHPDGSPWRGEQHPPMQTLASGEPCLGQVMGVHKPDGSLTWILVNAMPIRQSGQLVGVACSFLDLSPFRETEGQIRRHEERFKAVARNVPGVIYRFVVHPGGRTSFPYIGEQIEDLFGLTVDEWRANPHWALEAILPEDRPSYDAAYEEAAAELRTFQWEGRTRTARPGEIKWIRCQSSPTELPDGSLQWDGFVMDTTPIRRAEDAFRRQESFQRAILASAQMAIISTDLDGIVTSLNPHAETLLGYTSAELVGRQTPTLWHDPPEVASRAEELSRESGLTVHPGFEAIVHGARRGYTDQREWTFVARDGTRIPVLLAVSGIRDAEDTLVGFLGVAADLRELRAREAALKASEARFRGLVASVPGLVFEAVQSLDGSLEYTFVSEHSQALLGLQAEEAIVDGSFIENCVLEEDRASFEVAAAARSAPASVNWIGRVRARDGKVLWVHLQVHPTPGPHGSVTWHGLMMDLTHRIEMELALKESESRSQALLSALPDMVLRLDAAGTVLDARVPEGFITPSAEPMDPRGHSMREFLPPVAADRVAEGIRHALTNRTPEQIEIQVLTPQGPRDHELRIHPSGLGEVVFLVRDITDRKAIDRMKGEFISTVSHELRTPITSIRGALGLLEAGVAGEVPQEGQDLLKLARVNTERLLRLVNDILDFEKTSTGQLTLKVFEEDLRELVKNAVAEAGPFAGTLGVNYRLHLPPEPARARVDALRFQQVMTNLLSNAAKYSPKGAGVEIHLRREGASWRVQVENLGPPIPAEFRPRIFERFAMADASDAGHRGGTGLGLAISRSLVERMGGRIDFTSNPDRTCFFLLLPAVEPPR